MSDYVYASVAQLRDFLSGTNYSSSWTSDTASLLRILRTATTTIETYCGHNTFAPITATLDFDEGSGQLSDDTRPVLWNGTRASKMLLPWFVSMTSATLYTPDRSSSTALVENTDYLATPYAGFPPGMNAPYNGIKYKTTGSANENPFSESGQRVLALAAEWGYQDEKSTDSTATTASTTASTLTVASSTNLSAGQAILVDSERMLIESVTDATTVEVKRAIAGTTGATHSAATINIYKFPDPIVQACLELSELSWIERGQGLTETIDVAGTAISIPRSQKDQILQSIDMYATFSAHQAVTF